MPKLINDVLLLVKEQKIAETDKKERSHPIQLERRGWYRGLSAGTFLVLLLFGGASYFNLVNQQYLAMIALGTAIFVGITSNLLPKTRKK